MDVEKKGTPDHSAELRPARMLQGSFVLERREGPAVLARLSGR